MALFASQTSCRAFFGVIIEQYGGDVIYLYLVSQTMFYGPIIKTRSACSLQAVKYCQQQVY